MNIKPLDILQKYYGYTSFRKGQENIMRIWKKIEEK